MHGLDGKVAWLTGAGTGIGRAAALVLAGAGVRVALSGRRQALLTETARAVEAGHGQAVVEPLDVCDAGAVAGAVDRIVARFGRLDILVNNAGLNLVERHLDRLTPEAWDKLVNVNLNGAFRCAWAVLPVMRRQQDGLIVHVASMSGKNVSHVAGPAYVAAKHGMVTMSASINIEEGRHGIRSCALCPGEVDTENLDFRPVPVTPDDRARILKPEDLAEIILFVARLPRHVCMSEVLVSPTWNRANVAMVSEYAARKTR
jgi:NAD(P)-dependent dehydrogenase (short-subunit alcohol dehydrogenase family)